MSFGNGVVALLFLRPTLFRFVGALELLLVELGEQSGALHRSPIAGAEQDGRLEGTCQEPFYLPGSPLWPFRAFRCTTVVLSES